MALPDVSTTIQDGALGISPATNAVQSVTMGVCEKGVVGTLYAFSDPATAYLTLGEGQLTEAVCLKLALAGGLQYALPVTPLFDGAASASVTKIGSGAGTVSTVAFGAKETIVVTCTTTGDLGAAQFTFKLGSAATSAPVTSASGWSSGYQVVGTLTKLSFIKGAGATYYEAGDVFTVATTLAPSTNASVARTGTSTGHVQQTSVPLDDYDVRLVISKTGGRAAGEFRYSLDGGNKAIDGSSTDGNGNAATGNYEAAVQIPSNGLYAIPNTCILVTFADASFTRGDLHSFFTVGSGFNTTGISNAFTSLYASTNANYDLVHIAGQPTSAANAASLASAADSGTSTGETTHKRFISAITECPSSSGGGTIILSGGAAIRDTADTDTVITTGFLTTTSKRVATGAGDFKMVSAISGRQQRRNVAWIAAAIKCRYGISTDIGEVARGGLPFVKDLFRDERSASTSLDSSRLITLRTYVGKVGFFLTQGITLANTTSDFSRWANRHVMDRASSLAYVAGLEFVNKSLTVNRDGTISDGSAQEMESRIRKAVDDVLLSGGHLSGETTVTVSRTENVLSTSTVPTTIRILPLGYAKYVNLFLGFTSPALAAAALAA